MPKARPARVWQPSELARSSVLVGFAAQQWARATPRSFWPQEIPTISAAATATQHVVHDEVLDDGGAEAPLATPDPIDFEPAPPISAALSDELLESIRSQAYAQGAADCEARLKVEMAGELLALQEQDKSLLAPLEEALAQLKREPQQYFEPLKRLALHLAEQLVLAELSLDGKAIERVVQRCVDDLASLDDSMILVELNPTDLPRLEALRERLGLNRSQPLKLKANASLLPGSARASANDAMVQDLIEHRLSQLARALSVDEVRWKASSALDAKRLAAEHIADTRAVEDALPRMAAAPAQVEHNFLDEEPAQDLDDV